MDPKTSGSSTPLAGPAQAGWSNEDEATATCLCGAVQLAFPVKGPAIQTRFVCHCADCHKLSASMFSSAFIVAEEQLRFIRGKDNLTSFNHSQTVATGNTMTNGFCSTCGVLMYRSSSGFPGAIAMRLGPVDDLRLAETSLKPDMELFVGKKAAWLPSFEGLRHFEGGFKPGDV